MAVRATLDLLRATSPDLYLRNAFRVCGLPVNASWRDLRRRSDELRAAERLGVRPATGVGLLPLEPPPDAATVDEALLRLRDPLRRIVEELFWFWPLPDGDPGAIADRNAAQRWERLAGSAGTGSAERAVAVHNLAVLAHATALRPSAGGGQVGREKIWRRAYRYWGKVLKDDACWQWLEERVRALDDPRLRPETARDLRDGLPGALLRVHAAVALRAADEKKDILAKQHVSLMRGSGLGGVAVERALGSAVEPVTARLHARCGRMPDPTSEFAVLEDAARSLLADTRPDLDVLRLMVGERHPLIAGSADEVAARVNVYAVGMVNGIRHREPARQAEQTRRARAYLVQAQDIAVSAQIRTRIDENLAVVENNLAVLVENELIECCRRAVEDARRTPRRAHERASTLLRAVQPLLEQLRESRTGAHGCDDARDEVAVSLLLILTEYLKATGDLVTATDRLLEALQYASSAPVRQQLTAVLDLADPGYGRPVPPDPGYGRPVPPDLGYGRPVPPDPRAGRPRGLPPAYAPPRASAGTCELCRRRYVYPRTCHVTMRKARARARVSVICCQACWARYLKPRSGRGLIAPAWFEAVVLALAGIVAVRSTVVAAAAGQKVWWLHAVISLVVVLGLNAALRRTGPELRRREDAARELLARHRKVVVMARDGWRIDTWSGHD